jgi:hypothetical protein
MGNFAGKIDRASTPPREGRWGKCLKRDIVLNAMDLRDRLSRRNLGDGLGSGEYCWLDGDIQQLQGAIGKFVVATKKEALPVFRCGLGMSGNLTSRRYKYLTFRERSTSSLLPSGRG